jgi:MAP/microtubule affinity-regulating kinase
MMSSKPKPHIPKSFRRKTTIGVPKIRKEIKPVISRRPETVTPETPPPILFSRTPQLKTPSTPALLNKALTPSSRTSGRCQSVKASQSSTISTSFDCQVVKKEASNKIENYTIGIKLGDGPYSVVHLATEKATKNRVAIKFYEKAKLSDVRKKSGVKREIEILQKLSHPHIVTLYDVIDNSKNVCLVMEYASGSLRQHLRSRATRRLDEPESKRIFRQLLSALDYCHMQNITHRDIKLENILLDDNNNVKLIDFGFATCMPKYKKTKLFCGTPHYMAPEIIQDLDYFGPPVDMWAMGILLYTMLSGTHPFIANNERELNDKIKKGVYKYRHEISPEAKSLISKLLQVAPEKRYTTSELKSDPWVIEEESTGSESIEETKEREDLYKLS